MAKTEEAPVRREFTNELGNRIVITVTREVPDTDLVCTECRWRAGHAPGCTQAKEPWPSVTLDEERTLIRIEGPASVSENFLTPIEAAELSEALRGAAPALEWQSGGRGVRYVDIPRFRKHSLRVYIDADTIHDPLPSVLSFCGYNLGPEGVRMLRAACDEYLAEVDGG